MDGMVKLVAMTYPAVMLKVQTYNTGKVEVDLNGFHGETYEVMGQYIMHFQL